MKLSEHFTLAEATKSSTANRLGVSNQPNETELEKMIYTAEQMEKVRKVLGDLPIRVSSWYRSPEVNRAVGGTPTSQHSKGEAVDFTCALFGSAKEVALELSKHKEVLQYDQLIYEQTWVHISFVSDRSPRKLDLTWTGKRPYLDGIV